MSQVNAKVTLTGDLAAWLIERAQRNTRTPEQELTHILTPFRERQAKGKARRAERLAWGKRYSAAA